MTLEEKLESVGELNKTELKKTLAKLTGKPVASRHRPWILGQVRKYLKEKAALDAKEKAAAEKAAEKAAAEEAAAEEAADKAVDKATEKAADQTQAKKPRKGRCKNGERDPRLPPVGTVLEREYKGKLVRATVLEDGFEHEGKTYRSPSTLVKAATGVIWNGFLFFKLTPYAKRRTEAA